LVTAIQDDTGVHATTNFFPFSSLLDTQFSKWSDNNQLNPHHTRV